MFYVFLLIVGRVPPWLVVAVTALAVVVGVWASREVFQRTPMAAIRARRSACRNTPPCTAVMASHRGKCSTRVKRSTASS